MTDGQDRAVANKCHHASRTTYQIASWAATSFHSRVAELSCHICSVAPSLPAVAVIRTRDKTDESTSTPSSIIATIGITTGIPLSGLSQKSTEHMVFHFDTGASLVERDTSYTQPKTIVNSPQPLIQVLVPHHYPHTPLIGTRSHHKHTDEDAH
jgi:hypothetical protein